MWYLTCNFCLGDDKACSCATTKNDKSGDSSRSATTATEYVFCWFWMCFAVCYAAHIRLADAIQSNFSLFFSRTFRFAETHSALIAVLCAQKSYVSNGMSRYAGRLFHCAGTTNHIMRWPHK